MLEGIGLTELLLVTVISLIVLGPERLPSALTYVKKYLSKFNRTVREVKEELEMNSKLLSYISTFVRQKKKIEIKSRLKFKLPLIP